LDTGARLLVKAQISQVRQEFADAFVFSSRCVYIQSLKFEKKRIL